MKDFIRNVILPTLATIVASVVLASGFGYYSCSNYEKVSGKPTRYLFADACYIQTKNGWQRWDEYKARATTNE